MVGSILDRTLNGLFNDGIDFVYNKGFLCVSGECLPSLNVTRVCLSSRRDYSTTGIIIGCKRWNIPLQHLQSLPLLLFPSIDMCVCVIDTQEDEEEDEAIDEGAEERRVSRLSCEFCE